MKKEILTAAMCIALTAGCSQQNENTVSQESSVEETMQNETDLPEEDYSGLRETARTYVQMIKEDQFNKLIWEFSYSDEMSKVVKSGQLEQVFKSIGQILDMEEESVTQQKDYVIVSVPLQMEDEINRNLNIVFDQEEKIAGINFSEYSGSGKEYEETNLPEGLIEEELDIFIGEGMELQGLLTRPETEEEYPAVILVHGSGPNDMDETMGPNKPFRDLAWMLAKRGIAVYRYDKRTFAYGQECADDLYFTIDDETVSDAVVAAALLRESDNIDEKRVYVLGHSLGGFLIPRIAEQIPDAAGFIMMGAPVSDLDVLMRMQYGFLTALDGEVSEKEKSQLEEIYAQLDRAGDYENVPEDEMVMGCFPAYWKSLKEYDCLESAAKIEKPVLVLQGEEDYQVPTEEFDQWKAHFGQKENWEFQLFPGLTHLMMEGKKENGPLDYQGKRQVDEKVADRIAEFIKNSRD